MALNLLTNYYGIDILAMFLTFLGLYFIGNKKRKGFIIASLGNTIWVTLGFFTEAIGLIFANLIIIILYIRGYQKWKK